MSDQNLTTFEEIIFKSPLYNKISLESIDIESIEEYVKTDDYQIVCNHQTTMWFASMQWMQVDFIGELRKNFLCFIQRPENTTIDCYCKKCNKAKSFLFQPMSWIWVDTEIETPIFINLQFECITCKEENLYFSFKISRENIEKVWEYPSKYDVSKNNISEYRGILWDNYDEYCKAIIVHSLWFSIWWFTYLRRIFEKFIFEMFKEHKDDLWIKFEEFKKMHKEDQFSLLKPYFPDWINTNKKTLYGILSIHIHELTEDSAVNFFPLIKRAIDIVVKYRFEALQASKEEDEVEKELQKAHSILKA